MDLRTVVYDCQVADFAILRIRHRPDLGRCFLVFYREIYKEVRYGRGNHFAFFRACCGPACGVRRGRLLCIQYLIGAESVQKVSEVCRHEYVPGSPGSSEKVNSLFSAAKSGEW